MINNLWKIAGASLVFLACSLVFLLIVRNTSEIMGIFHNKAVIHYVVALILSFVCIGAILRIPFVAKQWRRLRVFVGVEDEQKHE